MGVVLSWDVELLAGFLRTTVIDRRIVVLDGSDSKLDKDISLFLELFSYSPFSSIRPVTVLVVLRRRRWITLEVLDSTQREKIKKRRSSASTMA